MLSTRLLASNIKYGNINNALLAWHTTARQHVGRLCNSFLFERIWLPQGIIISLKKIRRARFSPLTEETKNRWFDAVAASLVRLTTTHWDTAEIWVRNANCSYDAANRRKARKYQLGCLESPVNLINIISGKLWKCRNAAGSQAAKSVRPAFAFVQENIFCLEGRKRLRPFITATVFCLITHNPSKTLLLN